jgi:RNA polymerase sigma-70 factor (ECF subfamily)
MPSCAAIAQGEHRAMALLFTRHNVRIFRFAFSITGDRSTAESVVSDVFLDVWRHAAHLKESLRYQPGSSRLLATRH